MKPARLPLVLSLLVLLGSALPAQAQRSERGDGPFMRDRPALQENMQDRLQERLRERRSRDEGGSAGSGEGNGAGRGRHQLSPEERQQLRRDIHEAGRDIYRHERPQRRSQRR